MKEHRKALRRAEIEAAAQEVLIEKGYAAASILDVAKRAKASNETLYRWYGDKLGLFAALVARNAAGGMAILTGTIAQDAPLEQRLEAFGRALLKGILSDSAVELNRAAAADATGQLGKSIAENGRDAVMPLLQKLFATSKPNLTFASDMEAAESFIALLVSDMQARRIIGTLPSPDEAFIDARVDQAIAQFKVLGGWDTSA
ncbi:TetR/AcrR family transcriptional regulator [Primorskyibacter sp. S187A]|uniref:TetR/AcrR family transcriptional regulator n=1 Tax=Primorskyibacter sp. S187A TaxID=3415130 RepID=UPI003C7A0DC5